ncbi:MAG: N-acetylmuramoyl-L-alanine amidase [Planctomycetota bacterium]
MEVFRATRRSASHRSDKVGASRDLAASIYAELQRVSPHGDRGVKDSPGFRVLKLNENPAVLLELGFVSNPEEARLLSDPAYRARLAEAIAAGLEAYAS